MLQNNPIFVFLFLLLIGILAYINRRPLKCSIDPIITKLHNDMLKLEPAAKSLELYKDNESYTLDKQKIFMCVTDENGNYYPYDMLINVLAHELSHAMQKDIDPEHKTKEFKDLNRYYLQKAEQLGLLQTNYKPLDNYCTKK